MDGRALAVLTLIYHLAGSWWAKGQSLEDLVGVWLSDEGFQVVELVFRSDGKYRLSTTSTDPNLDLSSTEPGSYAVSGGNLILTAFDHFGEAEGRSYEWNLAGTTLTLTRVEFGVVQAFQFVAGSRQEVLAKESVPTDLVGTWWRDIPFAGRSEYTFRPGGYYQLKHTPDGGPLTPEIVRGRYVRTGSALTLHPYGGIPAPYTLDFYGPSLTLIKSEEFFGESSTWELHQGSRELVQDLSEKAEALLNTEHWQVGLWEIRDGRQTVDLTLRPDGYYLSHETTEFLAGVVRGRYLLEDHRIHLMPFVGQDLYARSNGEFGKVARTRELDYYDGELQFIDLNAISQSVTLARKVPGSEAAIFEKVREAREIRERVDWPLGVWEVHDPLGWMEFTFRPDRRYIAKSGSGGVAGQVERGRYRITEEKMTLGPYSGLGPARGFEMDLYDGDLFLIGDLTRMVLARKIPGSELDVIRKTEDPDSLKGEGGTVLGLWTAPLPGQSAQLVFRPDGEYRLSRCEFDSVAQDYGLYAVDMAQRTLVLDSRFSPVQTQELDFYGDTLTLHGGLGAPRTYRVHLGIVEAAIESSHAADKAEAVVDGQWLARVPTGSRATGEAGGPPGPLPADPRPDRIFESGAVLANYQLYRRLIPGLVFFNDLETIRSVNVVNTREWHFFPQGRVLIRFQNHRAGAFYPNTIVDETTSWGAYRVEPKPDARDILHLYADNVVVVETDLGETMEMTLEDGRRNLFLGKDHQILSEWASERQPIPCELPPNSDSSLLNTGLALSTSIPPDELGDLRPRLTALSRPGPGSLQIRGITANAGRIAIERARNLGLEVAWETWANRDVPGGSFVVEIPPVDEAEAYFRLRELSD